MTMRLSEVRCPECGQSYWQQQRIEDGQPVIEQPGRARAMRPLDGYWFRCFEGHVWQVLGAFIYDAFENHAEIKGSGTG